MTALDPVTWLLNFLVCPQCRRSILRVEAGYECASGHLIPIRDGVIDATAPSHLDAHTADTFRSFGFEWTHFNQIWPEDEEFWLRYAADLDLAELNGKYGLDAGCGKGRFSRFLAPHLAGLVALDGSDAVTAAVANLSDRSNTCVIRADLRTNLFLQESFGFISCLGVLHHLEEPEDGFRHLVELLSPGGTMLLYLYSKPTTALSLRGTAIQLAQFIRRYTVQLDHGVLKNLSLPIAVVLYCTLVLLGRFGDLVHSRTLSGLPLGTYRQRPIRSLWLDTFDRLSAPIEHRYTWDVLAPWFSRLSLIVESARDEAGWFVVLRKPNQDSTATD